MNEKIIIAAILSLLILPVVSADITYQSTCHVNNCPLSVSDCSSGLIDFFSKSDCSGNPSYEFTFSGGVLPWNPTTAQSLYVYALCDDGRTRSACSAVTVNPLASNITTSTIVTTQNTASSSSSSSGSSDNSNLVYYVLLIIVIVVVAFIAYRLFFAKKKTKIDYETLYKKWGR